MPSRYDAVIFDLYGTLVDNPEAPGRKLGAYNRALEDTASALGTPVEEFARLWRSTTTMRMTGAFPSTEAYMAHLCHEMGVHPEEARLARAAQIRMDVVGRQLAPRRDSVDTLARLRCAGYRIGLISDCSRETALHWPGTPLAALVDAAVLSCEVGVKKPDRRIYEMAYARLDVAPERCLYIGDGQSDELAGAQRVGMVPVRIRVPYERRPDDGQSWSGPEIASVGQVLELLGVQKRSAARHPVERISGILDGSVDVDQYIEEIRGK